MERNLGDTMNQPFNHSKEIFCRMFFMILVTTILSACTMRSDLVSAESSPSQASTASSVCGPEIDLNESLNKLSSEVSAGTAEVTKMLAERSRRSPECRTKVITALIRAMNNSELNFLTNRNSFFLWSNGSELLGELKAVEALDLLIQHLDLNDGEFSASMNHQPAIKGVVLMGALAVPKLSLALRESKNRNIRLAAALCLVEIEGEEATTALTQALGSEADPCVINFIRISLTIAGKERDAKNGGSSPADTEALTELRRRLVLAFRCSS